MWRPENDQQIVELTSRAIADIKKGNVVVMSADLDAAKLERTAKCLKPRVFCYITNMAEEKIEKILCVVDLGVILFLGENIRLDASKCQLIVEIYQRRIPERSSGDGYAEDLRLRSFLRGYVCMNWL